MAEMTSIFGHQVTEHGDTRPGDRVTILLHSDLWTRTSFVDADGFYVGCGAVDNGRADIVSIRRWGRP